MRLLAFLVCAIVLQINEASKVLSSSASALEVELQTFAAEKDRLKASMTLQHAIKIMDSSGRVDRELLSVIKNDVGKGKGSNLRKDAAAIKTSPGGVPPGAAGNSQSNYNGGVWNALYKINDMLLETVEKGDMEQIRCASYNRTSEVLMEEIKEDLALYVVLIFNAEADKNAAESKITEHESASEKLEEELHQFLKEIGAELTSLNTQLRVAEGDNVVMEKILNMSQCSDGTDDDSATLVQVGADLLQCVNTKTGKSYTKLHFNDNKMRKEFARMKHPKVMQLLAEAGIHVDEVDLKAHHGHKHKKHKHHDHIETLVQKQDCGCSCHNDSSLQVLFGSEQANNTCQDRDGEMFSFLDTCCIGPGTNVQPCCAAPTLSPAQEVAAGASSVKASAQVDEAMQNEKCSLKDSNKCPELRERFLNIAGGIDDTITQLKHLIHSTEQRGEHGHKIMQAELAYHKEVGDSETEKLGRAMAILATTEENHRMKQELLTTTQNEYEAEVQKCTTTLEELANEECALGKIRGELLNMDALPNNITDCLVSQWTAEECSLTCGGGTQKLVRTMEIEADHGYHCPVLEAMQSCNEPRCPLDCELADWTGWSACSAYCDGGVMDRIRPITQHNTKDGTPCETSDDSQTCNVQACDKDCVLHDWTEWTVACTKVCGGGRQMRFKHVKEHEYGEMGTCPEFHDAKRFQWKLCNTHDCEYDDHYPMTCEAKLDVMLVIDASGSMGSAGWSAVKKAAKNVAAAMSSGIKVGALAFSSPWSWYETRWCMGYDTPLWWKEFYFHGHSDCGIKWIEHMTEDSADVADKIAVAQAAFRGTLTNIAIDTAGTELRNRGRDYAQSILIVFTDGYPESKERTFTSSKAFQQTGRVIYVPVGNFGDDEYFESVASYPVHDNLVPVENFKALAARQTLDRLMPNFCPNIVQHIPQTNEW